MIYVPYPPIFIQHDNIRAYNTNTLTNNDQESTTHAHSTKNKN